MENVYIGANSSSEEIAIYTPLPKEFHDVFAWYYKEMPSIDLSIVEHEIRTYPNFKPFRQNLRHVSPCKAAAVKVKVKKLLNVGFICPFSLKEWVSKPVPVEKK